MKKILLATPHMPPTPGGPSTHAKKLQDHFNWELFNFEKYKKLPSGIRHLFAFVEIFIRSINKETILALDGFSVALPSIIVGKILRKKVILRVGGDMVHEQYVENFPESLDTFYDKIKNGKIKLGGGLMLKYFVQRFIYAHCNGIIFTTEWQRDIYSKIYSLPDQICVVYNPVENLLINQNLNLNEIKDERKIFLAPGREIKIKNLDLTREVFREINNPNIILDTKRRTREQLFLDFQNAHCFFSPSVSDISPNAVLEAISFKLPIILTKNTGFYKILEKAGVGIFVDPFSKDDIKSAIFEMCDNEKYSDYKKNLAEFIWPQTWNTLYDQYQEILK